MSWDQTGLGSPPSDVMKYSDKHLRSPVQGEHLMLVGPFLELCLHCGRAEHHPRTPPTPQCAVFLCVMVKRTTCTCGDCSLEARQRRAAEIPGARRVPVLLLHARGVGAALCSALQPLAGFAHVKLSAQLPPRWATQIPPPYGVPCLGVPAPSPTLSPFRPHSSPYPHP